MHASELQVPDRFRHEVLRRTPVAGAAWLAELPGRCAELCRRWRLTISGPVAAGGTSMVVPVIMPAGRAALKIIGPTIDATTEATALQAFDGDGVVRLFEADPTANALLLEWLPGPSLDSEPDPQAAVRIAGGLAARLGQTPAPAGIAGLDDGAEAWRHQLIEQHEAADQAGLAFPDDLFAQALQAVAELGRSRPRRLTHGDLSLDNVLSDGDGRWVAIDPLLVAGPVAHEVHTIVRSRLPEIGDTATLAELTKEAARAAEVDHGWASRLSLARYVASAYWESQNGGDPDNVRRLRTATLFSVRLIS
ncbi:aminoglycoside phosphotransferase family protein [Microlunatus parietis]|uniref:Streptomycin 6-kinase n=1 Tax=Microlunatus parietis TaxID=682979 RepID=A0A7Y9L9G8_9ACTN|nr:aminoglycoside phosphotransferase family protein [Microlunatus parietis]NYE71774.1 streptomycin 6-kinase [Microlunatus parietis]